MDSEKTQWWAWLFNALPMKYSAFFKLFKPKIDFPCPGPRGFLLPRGDEKREKERSGERKPLVAGDANLTTML